MATLIFTFDIRSGQVHVESSKFENENFLLKTYLSPPVWFQDSKNVICFVLPHSEILKIGFQKVASLPLPGFWTITQPKIKILAWIFVHLLLAHISVIRIPVFGISKKMISSASIFDKLKFWLFVVKNRNFENPR